MVSGLVSNLVARSILLVVTTSTGRTEYWCRLSESNGRPTAYKAVALPTELNRQDLH